MLNFIRTIALAALALAPMWSTAEEPNAAKSEEPKATEAEGGKWTFPGDAYPMSFCAMDDNNIGAGWNAFRITHEGTELRLCAEACLPMVESYGRGEFVRKIAINVVQKGADKYPLTSCVACEGALPAVESRVNYVYRNRLVQFDREECLETFKKDPDKHIARQNELVVETQKADYPAGHCVACLKALDPTSADLQFFVHGVTLFVLCSEPCVTTFNGSAIEHHRRLDDVRQSSRKKFLFAGTGEAGKPEAPKTD